MIIKFVVQNTTMDVTENWKNKGGNEIVSLSLQQMNCFVLKDTFRKQKIKEGMKCYKICPTNFFLFYFNL